MVWNVHKLERTMHALNKEGLDHGIDELIGFNDVARFHQATGLTNPPRMSKKGGWANQQKKRAYVEFISKGRTSVPEIQAKIDTWVNNDKDPMDIFKRYMKRGQDYYKRKAQYKAAAMAVVVVAATVATSGAAGALAGGLANTVGGSLVSPLVAQFASTVVVNAAFSTAINAGVNKAFTGHSGKIGDQFVDNLETQAIMAGVDMGLEEGTKEIGLSDYYDTADGTINFESFSSVARTGGSHFVKGAITGGVQSAISGGDMDDVLENAGKTGVQSTIQAGINGLAQDIQAEFGVADMEQKSFMSKTANNVISGAARGYLEDFNLNDAAMGAARGFGQSLGAEANPTVEQYFKTAREKIQKWASGAPDTQTSSSDNLQNNSSAGNIEGVPFEKIPIGSNETIPLDENDPYKSTDEYKLRTKLVDELIDRQLEKWHNYKGRNARGKMLSIKFYEDMRLDDNPLRRLYLGETVDIDNYSFYDFRHYWNHGIINPENGNKFPVRIDANSMRYENADVLLDKNNQIKGLNWVAPSDGVEGWTIGEVSITVNQEKNTFSIIKEKFDWNHREDQAWWSKRNVKTYIGRNTVVGPGQAFLTIFKGEVPLTEIKEQ